MNPLLSIDKRCALAVAAFLVALTITSTMDYNDAKLMERDLCKRNPNPEFCQEKK